MSEVSEPIQQRGDAFVQAVLEATLAQLAHQGFERLSIPQIAAAAGVNKTSVYRRWPTKQALVADVLQVVTHHTAQVSDTGSLRGDLRALALALAQFIQSPLGRSAVRLMLTQGTDPELRALAQSANHGLAASAPMQVIARAMQRGELKAGTHPALLLFTLAGAVIHRVFVEQGVASVEFVNDAVDLVLYGVSAVSAQAKPDEFELFKNDSYKPNEYPGKGARNRKKPSGRGADFHDVPK